MRMSTKKRQFRFSSIARLFGLSEDRCHSDLTDVAQIKHRRATFESLEQRTLLSVAPTVAPAFDISPAWFAQVPGYVGPRYADPRLWTADEQAAMSAPGSNQNLCDWIVQFDPSKFKEHGVTSVADTESLLAGEGIEFQVLRGLGAVGLVDVRSLNATTEAVKNVLTNNKCVASFSEDSVVQLAQTPNDPHCNQTDLWGMYQIQAPAAWDRSTGSSSVVVAVIDTGIDYNHPDIAANIWTNSGEIPGNGIDDDGNGFIDDVHGWDFVNNDSAPVDDSAVSHGTHVSGTIGAVGNNSVGVVGVNWSASLMALKAFDSQGNANVDTLIAANNYATMMRTQHSINVRVINASYGSSAYTPLEKSAIQDAGNAGILFVARSEERRVGKEC
jgi:hypothetical protein